MPRSTMLVALWCVLCTWSAGCGDGEATGTSDAGPADTGPQAPPERCAAFTAPGDGPRFRDVTDAWDVGPGGLDVLASRVSTGDLDGDGYPDVVVHRTGSHDRADFTAEPRGWPYRVLMNRARAGGAGRHFVDATLASGYGALRDPMGSQGRAAHLAIFADLDDDGDLDVFSGTYADRTMADTDPGDRSVVLLNDGSGHFTLGPDSDAIAGSDRGQAMPTTSATFLDYDRDGLLDLFVGYWYAEYGRSLWGVQDQLIRNTGGASFEDVTQRVGLATPGRPLEATGSRPTYGVTACDVDQDGDTDLLASSYGRQPNRLWLHTDAGYVEASGAYAADDRTDYDDNEFYKCYCQTTGSCTTSTPPRIRCDRLLWNAGIDDQPSRLGGNTFTTACADVDSDGDSDLYDAQIAHWHIGSSSDSSELVVNQGLDASGVPIFSRPGDDATGLSVPHVGASWNEGGISAALADLDGDGRMDALLGTSDYPDQFLYIYRQMPDGTFAEVSAEAGLRHPCAPGFSLSDIDRDGDLDLLVASSTARDCRDAWPDGPPLRVYENVSGQDANWTEITLQGSGAAAGGANRSAIGALVRVTAGGVTRNREVQAGYGHFGLQHDMRVVVGLGEACTIEAVEVRWPDAAGTVDRYQDVRANYHLRISQGGPVEYLAD